MTTEIARGARVISEEIAARLRMGEKLTPEQVREFANSLEGNPDAQSIRKTIAKKAASTASRVESLENLGRLLEEYEKRRVGEGAVSLKKLLELESGAQKDNVLKLVKPETVTDRKGKITEKFPPIDRATKIYRDILCAVDGKDELAPHEILHVEKRFAGNQRFIALQMSRAPLYPPNKEAGVAPPPTVSLSDIRNIARITKNPYVPVGLAQALTHGGILGDLAAEMIDASRDVHTDEAKKNRCTSIENSFSVIATLLPVAEKQLASLNKAEFAEKIISIQKWDRVKRMLEILVSIIEKIGKQDFPQQNNLPDGIANVVNKIHEKLCLEDAVPALRRQTPYTPADFKATTATFTPPALQEVNSRLTGFESEIGSYLKLLQAGWTLVAVAVGELGGNKLASGRGRAISRNQKSREISVFESNFKALNTPSPNA